MIEQSVLDYYMESSADYIFCITQLHHHFKKLLFQRESSLPGINGIILTSLEGQIDVYEHKSFLHPFYFEEMKILS